MAAGDQIVLRIKKIIKQKSSGLMSLWRSTSTSGVSDQIYGCYGQKTDFSCFLNFRAPNILIRFDLLLRPSLIFFFENFSMNPYTMSRSPLRMCSTQPNGPCSSPEPSQSCGHIEPPPRHLEVSLTPVTDRVKICVRRKLIIFQ